METAIPQGKPLLNRMFAITFALIIFTHLIRFGPFVLIVQPWFLLILVGLLVEVWKPSLDFTFHRNRTWIFASIILFTVVVLNSVYWWIVHGIPNWLPQYGWQATIVEWFMGNFAMETSSLSLMLGILFLTNSTPQKSSSYKIMLIGIVLLELIFFLTYQTAICGGPGGRFVPGQYKDFWGFTIFQPWFWLDLTSEIVISIGAVQLLRRAITKKLVLIMIFAFLVWFAIQAFFLLFIIPSLFP